MVEYRPLPADRRGEFSAMLSYAFSPESGPYEPDEEDEEIPPQARGGEDRGLFDGDDLRSVCRHYYFDTRVRGGRQEMAGLSAVATPPEHRRQGLIRTMLSESLAEYREREVALSTLWPFKTPFYAQFGWAVAFRYAVQTAEPSVFRIDEATGGRFYRAEEDDWEALDSILARHRDDYELAVDRTEAWWRNRGFHGWETDPYVYVWERDGDPRGYLSYSIDDPADGKVLRVWDLGFVDTEALHHLLRFVADHDSQVETAKLYGPADAVLFDSVDDPADLSVTVDTGAMVRIVDVEMALERLSYPDSLEETVTLAVADPLVDWNEGTFVVTFDDGDAAVSQTDATADLTLDVGTLSQLYVGYRSMETIVSAGDVTVHDDRAVDVLDAAFPESDVYLREQF